MLYEDTNPIVEETYTAEQQQQPEEVVQEQVLPEQAAPQPQQPQDHKNFRSLRERAERLERERNAAMDRLAQLEAQQKSREQSDDDIPDISINDDDIVEGKHLSAVSKQIKMLQKQLAEQKKQSAFAIAEAKMKASFPDIDKVLSEENIQKLNEMAPELAYSLSTNPDPYSKAAAAYSAVKKFGIYTEDVFEQDRLVAQRNAVKPRPLASVSPQQGDSPLSRANAFANGLTDTLKHELWREMQESRRNS